MRRIATFVGLSALILVPILAPAPAHGEGLEGELRDITGVGFQQLEEVSRVFVKTSDKIQYRVDSSREKLIVVTFENARVPRHNDTRPLETQYFSSPVTQVVAKVIEGTSPSVNLEIRLRKKVPYKVTQTAGMVAIDFTRE
jgi:hypothetical protein